MTDADEDPMVIARIPSKDLARLDHMAARRGVPRDVLVAQAIDALLAKETWSGGFIAPPESMRPPGPFVGRSDPSRWWRWTRT